jgi:hypothetical protein
VIINRIFPNCSSWRHPFKGCRLPTLCQAEPRLGTIIDTGIHVTGTWGGGKEYLLRTRGNGGLGVWY